MADQIRHERAPIVVILGPRNHAVVETGDHAHIGGIDGERGRHEAELDHRLESIGEEGVIDAIHAGPGVDRFAGGAEMPVDVAFEHVTEVLRRNAGFPLVFQRADLARGIHADLNARAASAGHGCGSKRRRPAPKGAVVRDDAIVIGLAGST